MSAPGVVKVYDPDLSAWVPVFVGRRGTSGVVKSDTPPSDEEVLWVDTSETATFGAPIMSSWDAVRNDPGGTTTNYGWPKPADADVVKDGAQAVRALGNAVDTELSRVSGLREIVTFTEDGSFVKDNYPWLRAVRVRVQGAGGGGGGSEAASAGESSVGRGGTAGALAVGFVLASALDASVSVTVGEGGAAGPANITGGSSGGASSFGAFVNGPGGGGAGGGIAAGAGAVTFPSGARSGAPAGTHVIHGKRGDGGGFAFRISGVQALSGFGASSPHGAGGAANASGAVGSAALGPGAGGGGAQSRDGEAARVGGAGADGVVIVELYGPPPT